MSKSTKTLILLITILLAGCAQHRQDEVTTETGSVSESSPPEFMLSEIEVPPDTFTPEILGEFAFAGEPVDTQGRNLTRLQNIGYIVAFDEGRNCTAWAIYRVSGTAIFQGYERESTFEEDTRTQSTVHDEDYDGSGFDRGHIAPGYGIFAFFGEEAKVETFLTSNICPQFHRLNAGKWGSLEQKIAGETNDNDYWAKQFDEIWVIAGPIYDDNVELLTSTTPNIPNIEIPDEYFMIIIDVDEANNELNTLSFIFPNTTDQSLLSNPLEFYLVSIDDIEAATGLDFFTELDDNIEEELEIIVPTEIWPEEPTS